MISTIYKHKKQIFLFIIAGVLSAFVEIGLMKLLSMPNILPSIFNFENRQNAYPLSNLISTGTAISLNYLLSIYFVFKRGKHSKNKEVLYFFSISICTMMISWGIFALFHRIIDSPVSINIFIRIITVGDIVLCKALAILLVSIINFIVKKKLIFNN